MAEHRLFVEGVERDPPEFVAAAAGELGEVLLGAAGELRVSELENWFQARPPTAIAAAIASSASASATPLSTAGSRESADGARRSRPPSPRSSRRSAANSSSASAVPASRISSTVTPWPAIVGVGEVVGEAAVRLHREHRRQRPEGADHQRRQHPEAVVGEDEQAAGGDASASRPPRE